MNKEMTISQYSGLVRTIPLGVKMWELCRELFPICRSITGDGVRNTLKVLNNVIPISVYEVPTGTKVFDWVVPKEWNIKDAFIADRNNKKVIDFKDNNLHVVGYSIPVDKWVVLPELEEHLYSLSDQPDAIPYVTSYYNETWGFCVSHNQRLKLKDSIYHVVIDSTLKDGNLTYGECIIRGNTQKEILLSTYICHPSMANNELSGPVVTAFIGQWLLRRARRYTYRIIFVPETIGSITYLSKHLQELKRNVVAGFNISCVGDDRSYSYVASRYGNSFADKVVSNVLSMRHPNFIKYSFLDRGSDERQYCSPGVDLPLVTLSRSKYGTYPEYHTSLDDLNIVTPDGLKGGFEFVRDCLWVIENNKRYKIRCLGEPQLGKRGLYPSLSTKTSGVVVQTMMDFIAYADGTNDLIDISNIIGKPVWDILGVTKKLASKGLMDIVG